MLTKRALKAEARVKEQQAELDEMEREKFTALIKLNGAAL